MCIIASIITRTSFLNYDSFNSDNIILFCFIRILIFFSFIYCLKLLVFIIKRIIQAHIIIPEFIRLYKQGNLDNIKSIIILYFIQNILFISLSSWILYITLTKLNLFIDNIYLYILVSGIISSLIFFYYYPIKSFNINTNIKHYPIWIYLLLLFFIIFYMFIFPLIIVNIINSDKFILLKELYLKKIINSNLHNNMLPNPNKNNLLICNNNSYSNNYELEYNNLLKSLVSDFPSIENDEDIDTVINHNNINMINNNDNIDNNNNNNSNNNDNNNNNTNNNNNYINNLSFLDKIFDIEKAIKNGTIYNNWYYLDKILNKEINFQSSRIFRLGDKIIFNDDINDLINIYQDQSELDVNSSLNNDKINNINNNTNTNTNTTNINYNINNINYSFDPNESFDLIGDDPFAASPSYYNK
jgi:hypothetical protein